MWLNCRPVNDETRGQHVSERGDALLNVGNSVRAFPVYDSWPK